MGSFDSEYIVGVARDVSVQGCANYSEDYVDKNSSSFVMKILESADDRSDK